MVVRMRSNTSHTGNRRAHHALRMIGFVVCQSCGAKALPHTMCRLCGSYGKRKVVDVLARIEKKEKKRKEKEKAAGTTTASK